SISARILIKEITTNSITTLSFGPELALPMGRVRPYVHAGRGELLFRTTSSIKGTNSSEDIASTTNYKDNAGAWLLAGGVRVPSGPARIRTQWLELYQFWTAVEAKRDSGYVLCC